MRAKSGAEATALQTLRAVRMRLASAQRLECGAFTAAFGRTKTGADCMARKSQIANRKFQISNRKSQAGLV
jgi:hypothetical protein